MRLLQKEHLLIFQSTLPDPRSRAPVTAIARFQSTLPERGETIVARSCFSARSNFNPLSPSGERQVLVNPIVDWETISIHSPRAGRDFHQLGQRLGQGAISIHSPRAGRDSALELLLALLKISIHSPRAGRDQTFLAGNECLYDISIHSPRAGRDARNVSTFRTEKVFQSTLPAWGETTCHDQREKLRTISIHSPRMGRDGPRPLGSRRCPAISIHSPRMGRDLPCGGTRCMLRYFNPLSPHGERQHGHQHGPIWMPFQSTLPAWGETWESSRSGRRKEISIHSPRMGRDKYAPP